jgi:hypothetical protein
VNKIERSRSRSVLDIVGVILELALTYETCYYISSTERIRILANACKDVPPLRLALGLIGLRFTQRAVLGNNDRLRRVHVAAAIIRAERNGIVTDFFDMFRFDRLDRLVVDLPLGILCLRRIDFTSALLRGQ